MHKVINSSIGLNFLGIKYNVGAVWEEPGKRGTSHLMEHLMCKTFDDQLSEMKRDGIDYNAYTSNNAIVFHFDGLDFKLKKYSQMLFDRITSKTTTLWSEEDFNKEKQVVLEEYGDSFNNPDQGAYLNLQRKYYNSFGPIGLRKDIENFSYTDSLKAAEKFMTPKLICEVGEKFIEYGGEFNTAELPVSKLIFGNYDVEEESVPKNDKTLVGLMGKKTINLNSANKLKLVIDCLNNGLESPLHQEIREQRSLSYFSASFISGAGQEGVPTFFASTSNEKVTELKDVYTTFFGSKPEELISQDRFDIIKEALMIEKMKSERLPHEGEVRIAMSDFDPYAGINDFTYEDALKVFNDNLSIDNLQLVES